MAIDILIVDLIPANPIELFGNRAQANTNRSGNERSIIELNRMGKRSRPPQGYYKSLEASAVSRAGIVCESRPEVLVVYRAERIVAKKIRNGKALFMVKWQGYCASENTLEPKPRLPRELIESFESPDPYPVRVEEARERIALVFERGMKVPLQDEGSIEIRHDVVRVLFPNLPAHIQLKPTGSYRNQRPRVRRRWTRSVHGTDN